MRIGWGKSPSDSHSDSQSGKLIGQCIITSGTKFPFTPNIHLDVLMVERDLVKSRALAQRLVLDGQVQVDGTSVFKPGTKYPPKHRYFIIERDPRYVSYGGENLESALQAFSIDIKGKVCADVAASTYGVTDCLLQYGAVQTYAIDVG